MKVSCGCGVEHTCSECPVDFEESKVIAEAFGLWPMNLLHKGHYWLTDEGHNAAGPTERHMWHALVRCYRTLIG